MVVYIRKLFNILPEVEKLFISRYSSTYYKNPTMATTAKDVLDFWFPPEKSSQEKSQLWFGGKEWDAPIKNQFGSLVEKARGGELASWQDLSSGIDHGLAFVILIDQFCRNIYRGTSDAFNNDYKSLEVAMKLIESVEYKKFSHEQRFFLYLPLEHNECMKSQNKCVELYEEMVSEEGGEKWQSGVSYAKQHREVIEKFGRFPKRNEALGRENTPEEIEAFKDWKYNF